ncbi:MAG: hypothetical protein ACTHJL_06505 [Amnibacterium sp.]
MSTTTATAPSGSATGRRERLGSLAMTGVLLLLCTGGLAATSIHAQTPAHPAAAVPIGR